MDMYFYEKPLIHILIIDSYLDITLYSHIIL